MHGGAYKLKLEHTRVLAQLKVLAQLEVWREVHLNVILEHWETLSQNLLCITNSPTLKEHRYSQKEGYTQIFIYPNVFLPPLQ